MANNLDDIVPVGSIRRNFNAEGETAVASVEQRGCRNES